MTVAVQTGRAIFNGNGSAGPFNFPFPFFDNSWITAAKAGLSGAVELTQNVDYYVVGAGNSDGGSLTLAAPLLDGENLYIKREIPLVQQVAFANFGAFFPETHEAAFDMTTMMLQQVNERVGDVNDRVDQLSALVDAFPAQQVRVIAAPNSSDTAMVLSADATEGSVEIDIAGLGEVVIVKDDDSLNTVSIIDSTGNTVCRGMLDPLSVQDEAIRLKLIGTDWKRI